MKAMQLLVLTGATLGMGLVGCDQKTNPVADAAKAAGGAVKDASKAAADTAAKTADAAKDAAAKAGDTAVKAAEAAKDAGTKAVDAAKDAGTKAVDATKDATKAAADAALAPAKAWVSDTVEKSWPAMKTQLESAGKAIPSIKDAATKTKAEGLFKDLTGQVPAIEGLVAKVKAADASTVTGLLAEAKKSWDGFGGKMKELTALLPK